MRESDLGDAMRATEPEPLLTDEERASRVRHAVDHRRSPVSRIALAGTAAAIVAAASISLFLSQRESPGDSVAPMAPEESSPSATLPAGTLECALESSYSPPDLGKISPDPLGVAWCEMTPDGFERRLAFEGDLTSLVDVINSLPEAEDEFSFCPGGDFSYHLVFGYADGHTEVVNGVTGGTCDVILVNQKDMEGATPVFEEFQRLTES